jgi:tetratricopeptide (TPR) repeat protein
MIGTQLGVGFYLARRYADAIREFTNVIDLNNQFWAAWHFLGLSLEASSRPKEAEAALEKSVLLSEDTPFACASLGHFLARAGEPIGARKILSDLENRSGSEYIPPYLLALIHCGLNSPFDALVCLERAREERSPAIALWLAAEPRLDPLRSELRFQRILQCSGLA